MKAAADIEREAAEWLMRRDREESAGEQADFESWLATDSRHRAAYLNLERTWRQSEGLKAWRPADGTLDLAVLTSAGSRRKTFGPWSLAIAASVALFVAVGIAWLVAAHGAAAYETEVGGYQRVLLRDGSVIQLNTDTRVRVRLGNDRREVRLVLGEAFFEVAHDPQRPFEVIAGDTTVRAVGTAFTVRLREQDAVEVVVTEGSVTLRMGESGSVETIETTAPSALAAGEAAVAGPVGVAVQRIAETEVARLLAWQNGELDFIGDPLSEVVAQFNRYNRRRLEIVDPAIAGLRVGGNFRATDLEGFLRAMRASFDVHAEESNGAIRLSRLPPATARDLDE